MSVQLDRQARPGEAKLNSLRERMDASGIDAVLVISPANIGYLTGLQLKPSERLTALLISTQNATAIVPALEIEAVQGALTDEFVCTPWLDHDGPGGALADVLRGAGARVGIERRQLTVEQLDLVRELSPDSEFIGCDGIFAALRIRKSPDELRHLAAAASIVDGAIEAVAAEILPGRLELDVVADSRQHLEGRGADLVPEPVILGGARSALPHGRSGRFSIQPGDLVVVDLRAIASGYWADITRTFVVGAKPTSQQLRLYDTVRLAREAALKAVRPGSRCADVDGAAREVISKAGFGHYFVHRTGHGLGVEGHEPPFLTGSSNEILEEGTVITIEPGIYIPGYGGLRLEDDFVIGSSGPEHLTASALELEVG